MLYSQYGVIRKSVQDFRTLQYSSRNGHAEGKLANRGRNTQSFRRTLQVLEMSTLGDAANVKPAIKFLPHKLQHLSVDSSDRLQNPSSQVW